MKPAIVFPLDDHSWMFFGHLRKIRKPLGDLFTTAYVSLSPAAETSRPDDAAWLKNDSFFCIIPIETSLPIGEHFRILFRFAADQAAAAQVLHIGFIDRLAYILQDAGCREAFAHDIRSLAQDGTPLIYQRSESAWASHPAHYREIERMIQRAGELLFDRSLDYAWCQVAFTAHDLKEVLRNTQSTDMSLLAEMVLACRDRVKTKSVDWLSWEDPFILGRDGSQLKTERDGNRAETQKRLAYAVPMLERLLEAAKGGSK